RTIKDEYDDSQPAFEGGAFNDYILRLTRSGWANPRGLPRGEVQRVRYTLEGRELWRESWSVLDRVDSESSLQRTLLINSVEEMKVLFLKPDASITPLGGEWVEEWNNATQLPMAVDVVLEIEKFGRVRRVLNITLQ
ncbi:type II secretion system minor pseudopilin GspJ, partial [bacterium]|nr:type II secretion system minor pseudopilin GspJ [bacterium]